MRSLAPDPADFLCSQIEQLGACACAIRTTAQKNELIAFFHAETIGLRLILLSVDHEKFVVVRYLNLICTPARTATWRWPHSLRRRWTGLHISGRLTL